MKGKEGVQKPFIGIAIHGFSGIYNLLALWEIGNTSDVEPVLFGGAVVSNTYHDVMYQWGKLTVVIDCFWKLEKYKFTLFS